MAPEKLQPVRGTRDLIDREFAQHSHVIAEARKIAALYGFSEWATPIFEDTRVFARSLGDTSDVVTKEMYTFEDRGGDSLTLRPENTASICRALVSNGLAQTALPRKVFYAGPMFRYERPQKGRFRQFHQIGMEILGAAEPLADAEVIAAGWNILQSLGVSRGTVLEINTLGDTESRAAYREAFTAYLAPHYGKLSPDSKMRFEKNPLRILDSKNEEDRALLASAPSIQNYLSPAALSHFDAVKRYLDLLKVPFTENFKIVRGLDYYSHTAFEFVTNRLGSQGTVLAGGRYDGLVEEMGGPHTPSIGWAAGIERLALLLETEIPSVRPIAVVPVGDAAEKAALYILQHLRQQNFPAEIAYKGNAKKRMERANRSSALWAVLVGEDEVARGVAQLKNLVTGFQREVTLDEIISILREGQTCVST